MAGTSIEWLIARRYLATRRRGRFLSLISLIATGGITLGVMALIIVIAVMTGLQREMQKLILGSSPHIYLFEAFAQGSFTLGDWQRLIPLVRAHDNVVAAEPFTLTTVFVIRNAIETGRPGDLFGIDPEAAQVPLTDIERGIRNGDYAFGPTRSGLPGVLIGSGLAGRLGAQVGDTLLVIAGERVMVTAMGDEAVRRREFEVTGVFATGMYEYDEKNLYVHMSAAQDLLGFSPDTVSGIAINVVDPWRADEVALALELELGPQYAAQSWTTLNGPLFSALKLEKLAMGTILFLIVLVAAFNIISTLVMVVAEKTREIGILKSMGMTDRGVLRIFMLQGITIGLIGTVLGLIGGLLVVWIIDVTEFIKLPATVYFIDHLPVALDALDVVTIVLVSVLIAFAATIHPARQASRLEPVDAIRHE